jgi:hypothetical protein
MTRLRWYLCDAVDCRHIFQHERAEVLHCPACGVIVNVDSPPGYCIDPVPGNRHGWIVTRHLTHVPPPRAPAPPPGYNVTVLPSGAWRHEWIDPDGEIVTVVRENHPPRQFP